MFDMSFGPGKKGNGVVEEEKREITGDFTEVSAAEGIDVYISQGSEYEILVEADENIIELIATDIRNGRLRVHAEENIGRATKKVYVTLPQITMLKSSSGADLESLDPITASDIELSASSGSMISLQLDAEQVDADASSGADIKIKGTADELFADASSGANIRARDFEVRVCDAGVSSGANISVKVKEDLTADASSGGNIIYDGDPSVKKNKSDSGNVRKY